MQSKMRFLPILVVQIFIQEFLFIVKTLLLNSSRVQCLDNAPVKVYRNFLPWWLAKGTAILHGILESAIP